MEATLSEQTIWETVEGEFLSSISVIVEVSSSSVDLFTASESSFSDDSETVVLRMKGRGDWG